MFIFLVLWCSFGSALLCFIPFLVQSFSTFPDSPAYSHLFPVPFLSQTLDQSPFIIILSLFSAFCPLLFFFVWSKEPVHSWFSFIPFNEIFEYNLSSSCRLVFSCFISTLRKSSSFCVMLSLQQSRHSETLALATKLTLLGTSELRH